MKPTFQAPGSKRLKLKFDEPLSNFAFKFKLRQYVQAIAEHTTFQPYEFERLYKAGPDR
jgi:hypothetical protein